jgi:hypothetical protein
VRRRLEPAPAVAAPAAEVGSSASTIIACRRFAPADTVNGSGMASVSVGTGDDGIGGIAVNVNGDSGDIGNGWTADGMVVTPMGFSFAWMGDANARGFGTRTGGAEAGSGRAVGAGGEGGVEGDGAFGAVVAVIDCDNFEGARGAYIKK